MIKVPPINMPKLGPRERMMANAIEHNLQEMLDVYMSTYTSVVRLCFLCGLVAPHQYDAHYELVTKALRLCTEDTLRRMRSAAECATYGDAFETLRQDSTGDDSPNIPEVQEMLAQLEDDAIEQWSHHAQNT